MRCFERIGPRVLRVEFADGSTQTIDFTPVLAGELYGPLQDPDVFSQVRLDPEVHTLVWPNGADFDPTTLHDWPLVVDESLFEPRPGIHASAQLNSIVSFTSLRYTAPSTRYLYQRAAARSAACASG